MKKVSAYVRTEMASHVVAALTGADCRDFTIIEGRRVIKGLPGEDYQFSIALGEKFEPVAKFEVVCRDENAGTLAELIRRAAHTGRRGDGVVFISPVEDAVHIADGRRGDEALGV